VDRNLALELVRATEAAALAAARWMGKGDAVAADAAAVEAMHRALNATPFAGTVALGEGDRDSHPYLYDGEEVGAGGQDSFAIALDALECTRSVAFGRSNAMSAIAIAPKSDFYQPECDYLSKLAVGPEAAGAVSLDNSVEENLALVARARGLAVRDLTVVMLDRERHQELIASVRAAGARLLLIPDGDVAAAIACAMPGTGIDMLLGTGGATAGVLAAAALRCLGGEIQVRRAADAQPEWQPAVEQGRPLKSRIYRTADLVRGDNVMFAATGITDGDVLNGVCFRPGGATTHSLVMRSKTKTRRFIVTEHCFDDKPEF